MEVSFFKIVLIETLWNVKTFPSSVSATPPSFNRNIVECKVFSTSLVSPVYIVLIETLWNVKLLRLILMQIILLSFNRNIVECKVAISVHNSEKAPSFNRNIVECKVGAVGVASVNVGVLIETLWNVK